jgi:transposase
VKWVSEEKLTLPDAAKRLGMSAKTLANWMHQARTGRLSALGESRRPVTEAEADNARLRREVAELRLERDLLKKAAAYFASESMRGTRS